MNTFTANNVAKMSKAHIIAFLKERTVFVNDEECVVQHGAIRPAAGYASLWSYKINQLRQMLVWAK